MGGVIPLNINLINSIVDKLKINIYDLETDDSYYTYYKNELFTGIGEEYKNNVLIESYEYKDGIPDGKYTSYYESGALESEATFLNGRMDGIEIIWYENGSIKEENEIIKGVHIYSKKWDKNGSFLGEEKYTNPFIKGSSFFIILYLCRR